MRAAFIILPFAVLAACADPRDICINEATRDTRVLNALISQTEGTLDRGYALVEKQDVRTVHNRCQGENSDGITITYLCDDITTVTTLVPSAVNLDDERDKLRTLKERLVQSQAASNQAVAQCIAQHPA